MRKISKALFLEGTLLADLRTNWIPLTSDDCTTESQMPNSKRKVTFDVLAFIALNLLSIPEYDEAVTESVS